VLVTHLFLEPLHATECAQRSGPRLILIHTLRNLLGDLALDVEAQLIVDLTDGTAPEQERPDSEYEPLKPEHIPLHGDAPACA
jgi:hypothetical protein